MHRRRILGSWALLAFLAGCGGTSVDAVPVSGVVKINGEPVEGVNVSFLPKGGDGNLEATDAVGTTDATGRYELMIPLTGQRGAKPGSYRVAFTAADLSSDEAAADGAPPVVEPIPPQYNVETTLEFTVPQSGADQANFDLEIPNFKR